MRRKEWKRLQTEKVRGRWFRGGVGEKRNPAHLQAAECHPLMGTRVGKKKKLGEKLLRKSRCKPVTPESFFIGPEKDLKKEGGS